MLEATSAQVREIEAEFAKQREEEEREREKERAEAGERKQDLDVSDMIAESDIEGQSGSQGTATYLLYGAGAALVAGLGYILLKGGRQSS